MGDAGKHNPTKAFHVITKAKVMNLKIEIGTIDSMVGRMAHNVKSGVEHQDMPRQLHSIGYLEGMAYVLDQLKDKFPELHECAFEAQEAVDRSKKRRESQGQ